MKSSRRKPPEQPTRHGNAAASPLISDVRRTWPTVMAKEGQVPEAK
jgi:hypothetical protein